MFLKGTNNDIFIGPFVGEFGHELFSWQAYAREYAKKFDHVIVASRKEYKFLYEDFYDEFVEVDPKSFNAGTFQILENENEVKKLCKRLESKYNINKGMTVMSPNISTEAETMKKLKEITPDYITFGNVNKEKSYDIIIHARNFQNFNGTLAKEKKSRDWDLNKWTNLVKKLLNLNYKIASIGLSGCAYHVEGTDNLLDITLSDLADTLRSSKIILGPSSGPMHFATLCNCKQLVWSYPGNKTRYLTEWNPFDVDVTFYDKDNWNPSVETVYKLLGEMI